MTVRVIRTIEYIYPDQDTAEMDMSRWTWYSKPNMHVRFRSCALFGPAINGLPDQVVEPPPPAVPDIEVRIEILAPDGTEMNRMHITEAGWHEVRWDKFPPRIGVVRALIIAGGR